MRGNLDFIYEARDRHKDTLYRLFLIWDRENHDIILLDGRSKPNNTALPESEYEEIAKLGRTVLAATPRPYATVNDVINILLNA